MKVIIAILYLLPNLWAQTPQRKALDASKILYNPGGHEVGRFVISYKDYEDIRIDSDWDGKIDYWFLKKGPTEVHIRFRSGQADNFNVKHVGKSKVSLASYSRVGEKFVLTSVDQRSSMLMNLTEAEAQCEIDRIQEKLKGYSQEIEKNILAGIVKTKIMGPECAEHFNSEEFKIIQNNLIQIIGQTVNRDNRSAGIASCLKDPKFKEEYQNTIKSDVPADLVSARFHLQAAQMANQPDEHSPVLRCEAAGDQKALLATTENGLIHVNAKLYKEKNSIPSTADLEHELLHRSGVESEGQVDAITNICRSISIRDRLSKDKPRSFRRVITDDSTKAAEDQSSKSSADTRSTTEKVAKTTTTPKTGEVAKNPTADSSVTRKPAATGSQIAASQATANIPKEMTVAQTSIPEAPRLSESISNPAPATEAGSQQALTRSASESSGVLRMANNLVGAMNSRANASDTLADKNSDTSSKSEVSSSSSSDSKSASSSKAKSNPFATLSRDKVGSGERVVEQITLDGNNVQAASATSSSSREVSGARAAQAAGPSGAKNNAPTGQGEVARGAASSGSGFSGGGGSGFNAATPSMGGSSGGSPSRAPAAVNPSIEAKQRPTDQKADNSAPRQQASANVSRDEVVTFISNNSYRVTKEKLQKPEFKKQLETQKITVLDLYGNTVGAPKGEVIFLDQGDRFVRQK